MADIRRIYQRITEYRKKIRPELYFRTRYIWYREHLPIQKQAILLEAREGALPTDNIAALLTELCTNPDYREYQIYLSGNKETMKSRKAYLKRKGFSDVTLLQFGTRTYFKMLATAKYLVTEVSFHFCFIKRKEQVYLNTWHGTPLKTLGKQVKSDYALIGNIQKNFFDADYLLCPNEFTRDVLVRDYMLANLAKTTLLLTGYPRNERFFDEERRKELRAACGFGDKQVIAFLPTWRGTIEQVEDGIQNQRLKKLFEELEHQLSEHQLFFVKLHQKTMETLDLSAYRKIRVVPMEYDTYEFLNASDVLVTDYSSVMFDYTVTGRKIILFPYDKEEYETGRGFYFPLEELPFPQVTSVNALVEELKAPKQYEDTTLLERFCPYDRPGVTAALCRQLIFGENSPLIKNEAVPDNRNPNIVLFFGNFEKNGITTAALNLLHRVDHSKYNFSVIYRMNDIKKIPEVVKQLPEEVTYLGFYRTENMTISEFVRYAAWKMLGKPSFSNVCGIIERFGRREQQRLLANIRMDQAIQYIGYVPEMIAAMAAMPCRRTIFVHSDMERESDVCKKIDKDLLRYAYETYDDVVTVTEGVVASTKRICETANVNVCRNVIDNKRIQILAEREFSFDEQTVCNVSIGRVKELLSSEKKKLVTIGRFSLEKGHERLIKAFECLHQKHPETCLFIVGGYGELYQKTVEWAAKSECSKDIVIIRYLSNPYPLLKQCDAFVMSSVHEALPVVLTEADILGLPCFCTDLEGPRMFLKEHGGALVENSEEGIYTGLLAAVEGSLPKRLCIDYEEYNRKAVEQFEALLPH